MSDHAPVARKPAAAPPAPPSGAAPAFVTHPMAQSPTVQRLHETARSLNRGAAPAAQRALAGQQTPAIALAPAPNHTGLPLQLTAGIEALSGLSLDDVRVHRNSTRPAQLQAHAFAQGEDIHLAPGQDHHLPHEAWHVVQQKQGRVRATRQLEAAVPVNDDRTLEIEADRMGMLASGGPAGPGPGRRRGGATQRRTVAQRELEDAINVAAPFVAKYGLHLNTMAEITAEKYLFTASEWQEIVTAYNLGGGSVRLRYQYDETHYIGTVEARIRADASTATTVERISALAERYLADAQARPGFYGAKLGRAAAGMAVGAATTLVAGPVVGTLVGAATSTALNAGALGDQVVRAKAQLNNGDYRNALVTLGQLGLSVGSSIASGTGHGHVAHVETAINHGLGRVTTKQKTD